MLLFLGFNMSARYATIIREKNLKTLLKKYQTRVETDPSLPSRN